MPTDDGNLESEEDLITDPTDEIDGAHPLLDFLGFSNSQVVRYLRAILSLTLTLGFLYWVLVYFQVISCGILCFS